MKFLAVTTLFFAAVLAAPTEVYPHPPTTYSLPANGGGSPPHGTVPPPTGNKPPAGNTPAQTGDGDDDHDNLCPDGLYSNPQCCSTQVLGVIGLDCATPSSTPTEGDPFGDVCARDGKEALCCVVPVAGQALLCQPVIGV